MINVKEFIYNELINNEELSELVWTRIYPSISPLNTAWPLILYNRVANSTIDTKGIRNDLFQISVWGKDININEMIMGATTTLFNGLKKPPVKYCYIKGINETFDKETWMFGLHITIHIKLFDVE